jgi:uncharacterized protein (DUF2126 family)
MEHGGDRPDKAPLPRWAFSLIWRKDGKPIWQNIALIADEGRAVTPSSDDAHRFSESLAHRLGVPAAHVLPAFEDPADRMLKEGALPPNVDPADPKIDDPIERARIMREFERFLSAPTGYVLPIQRWTAKASAGWISELWKLRRRRLFLVPGDAPIGLRLPLSSLPYVAPRTSRGSCRRIRSPIAERCPTRRLFHRTRRGARLQRRR